MVLSDILALTKEVNGKYYVRQLGGYSQLIRPSEINKIISDLKYYCKTYTDDEVNVINSNIVEHFFDCGEKLVDNKFTDSHKYLSGYIYLLKCADFYKIGYSKCVEQRIHQLDVRPFKLELINSWYSDLAYEIEQELHNHYKQYRAEGEWYHSTLPINTIENLIKELESIL